MTDQKDRGTDLDALTERAWKSFREVLAEALDALADGAAVLIELDAVTEEDGVAPYVRVVRDGGSFGVRAPGNEVLAEGFRLAKPVRRTMRELGLAKPAAGAPERWADVPVRRVDEVAHLVMTLLRDVYGVIHPVFLTSDDLGLSGRDGEGEGSAGTPSAQSAADDEPPAVFPVDRGHLDSLIDDALTPVLGQAPARDDDGDVGIRNGSAVVFIRSQGRNPVIQLFAEMVLDVTDSDAALHEVNVLNRDVRGVKFALCDDRVIASIDLLALPFAPDHCAAWSRACARWSPSTTPTSRGAPVAASS